MWMKIFNASIYRFLFLLVNFFVSLLVAKLSGATNFGIISLLIVNSAVFLLISGLGTDAAIIWHGAKNELSTNQVFSFASFAGIFQLLLFALLEFFSISFFDTTLLTQQASSSFLILEMIYFTGLILVEKYVSLFYALNKAAIANKVLLFVSSLFFVLLLLGFTGLFTIVNSFLLFCSLIFLQGISVSFVFHYLNNKIKFERIKSAHLKSLFHFSAIVFFTNLIQFFAYRSDYWILNYYFGKSEVGIYAQACQFAQLLWVAPKIIAALIVPAFLNQPNYERTKFLQLYRVISIFSIFIIIAIVLMAAFIYRFFFQVEFSKGFLPLLVMLPGYFLFISTTFFAAYFSIQKKLWINFINTAFCLIVIISLDFLLIPKSGMMGAAFANSVAYSIAALIMGFQFLKNEKISIREFWKFQKSDFILL